MSYFDSLPDEATLVDMFWRDPAVGQPLLALHEAIMRDTSPFTPAEREMIAAYVSTLNKSEYCHGVHRIAAVSLGAPTTEVDAACANPDAPGDTRMAPILKYVAKLTNEPSSIRKEDIQEILDAGWDEAAVTSAVFVASLYAFINRVVEGHGIKAGDAYYQMAGKRLADIGYTGLAELLTKGQ